MGRHRGVKYMINIIKMIDLTYVVRATSGIG